MLLLYLFDLSAIYLFSVILVLQVRLIILYNDKYNGLRHAFTTYNLFQLITVIIMFGIDLEAKNIEGISLVFAVTGKMLLNAMGVIGIYVYRGYDFNIFTREFWDEFLNGK